MGFVIPSIFTAIDKLSGPLKAMGRNVQAFAGKLEAGVARGERIFRKFTPALSETSKQLLAFASSAAIAGAIIGGIYFSVDSIKKYETAVASFRTIVSDLSDKDFAKFQVKINEVAKDTRKSAVDVAASFEKIAGLNASFAATAEGLGAVSQAAITLSKASGSDLGTSAENLVGIMNQFSMGALEANRAINVLAAGQAVGAANIAQTSDAFVNFGSVAAGANISLEQSVALVQTLGKFSLFGAEAGTKLRGSVLKLQQAGVGYQSGQFKINDALEEARKRIDKLKTAKQKDAALTKMFGAENISTGRILLSNIDLYNKFAGAVAGTNEAQKAADINSRTLTVALDELKNSWVNMLTGSDKATSGLNTANTVIRYLTDNLDTIVSVATKVVLAFAIWKAVLIASKIALIAYNVVLGITSALSGTASIAVGKNAIALGAYKTVLFLATAAQWLMNGALSVGAVAMQILMSPVTLIILAITALIALVTVIIKKWNDWGAALSLLLGPLGMIIGLIQAFRRNWDMITKAFSEGGILAGLRAIGATLLDVLLMPLQQVFKLLSHLPTWLGGGLAADAMKGLENFRAKIGVNTTTDESGKPLPEKEAVNSKAIQQDALVQKMENVNNAKVNIDINDPNGRATANSDQDFVKVNTTSTMMFARP